MMFHQWPRVAATTVALCWMVTPLPLPASALNVNVNYNQNNNPNMMMPFHQRRATALGYANDGMLNNNHNNNNQLEESLVGLVLNGQYVITRNIPVASKKCKIYEAFPVDDIEYRFPVIVKLSTHVDGIAHEHLAYRAVYDRLSPEKRSLFVEFYDRVEPCPFTNGQAGIIMEKGDDNLRFHIKRKGAYGGETLRRSMENVIRIVDALHEVGMIWTEVKAENFVVQDDGVIKAIDLESVIGHRDFLKMYTAESCPPEFPVHDMHSRLPQLRMDFPFDMWGLGCVLFEMATGKPFFSGGLTDLDYMKRMLSNHDLLQAHIDNKLLPVHPEAREIIKRCLEIDPRARATCRELLLHKYFHSPIDNPAVGLTGIPSSSFMPNNPAAHAADPPLPSHAYYHASHRSEGPASYRSHNQEFDSHRVAQSVYEEELRRSQGASSSSGTPSNESGFDSDQPYLRYRMEAILEAINACAQQNPELARDFMVTLASKTETLSGQPPQTRDGRNYVNLDHLGPNARVEAVTDAINDCARHNPEIAREFLMTLSGETPPRGPDPHAYSY